MTQSIFSKKNRFFGAKNAKTFIFTTKNGQKKCLENTRFLGRPGIAPKNGVRQCFCCYSAAHARNPPLSSGRRKEEGRKGRQGGRAAGKVAGRKGKCGRAGGMAAGQGRVIGFDLSLDENLIVPTICAVVGRG